MKFQRQWSRRQFLTSVAGAGATVVLNPLASWAADEVDPRVAALVAATIGIDTHKKHQPTIIQSVKGGHFLEGRLERLGEAYGQGLRHLGLLHDNDASVPLGDVYTKPAQWGGLTAFGADVIKECNRLGILVDLTHASNETLNTALHVTTKPVLISHTGLDFQLGTNPMMAKMMASAQTNHGKIRKSGSITLSSMPC